MISPNPRRDFDFIQTWIRHCMHEKPELLPFLCPESLGHKFMGDINKSVWFQNLTGEWAAQVTRAWFEKTFWNANPQESTGKTAEKFNCGRTPIQSILLKKDEILKAFEVNGSSNTKRSRGVKNEEVDNALLEWFQKARSKTCLFLGLCYRKRPCKFPNL